jgi:hypothetical protein
VPDSALAFQIRVLGPFEIAGLSFVKKVLSWDIRKDLMIVGTAPTKE